MGLAINLKRCYPNSTQCVNSLNFEATCSPTLGLKPGQVSLEHLLMFPQSRARNASLNKTADQLAYAASWPALLCLSSNGSFSITVQVNGHHATAHKKYVPSRENLLLCVLIICIHSYSTAFCRCLDPIPVTMSLKWSTSWTMGS